MNPIDHLSALRHSAAHMLAYAVCELYPDVKFGTGPVIEDGFYYDFHFSSPVKEDDLLRIEQKMKDIIRQGHDFIQETISKEKALQQFHRQPMKKELIEKFSSQQQTLTTVRSGSFVDLCEGGHVKNSSDIPLDCFTLSKIAGAYWQADEKNTQMTRIYGILFETKKELDEHLSLLAQAKERDHRLLGPKLELFFFHWSAPGSAYWLPKGLVIMNELIEYWREDHRKRGYQEISTPLLNKKELWERSGHWEFYKDDMFIIDQGDEDLYGLKPMNCPNAMIVFGSKQRSYRDLPLRLSDVDVLHRFERSGTLSGLLRARSFHQDDAHIFLSEHHIHDEALNILSIADSTYALFGLDYHVRLATRPEKYLGDPKRWDRAEESLKSLLTEKFGSNGFTINPGEGAFYGPKIDILMTDCLRREWQMGTIQLDFQLPNRFGLAYIDQKGNRKTPVVIHRVVYGALERFIAILIEHFAGALPFWISPIQIGLVPVGQKQKEESRKIALECENRKFRVHVFDENETVSNRIRHAIQQKIPKIVVIGQKEVEAKTMTIRSLRSQNTRTIPNDQFFDEIEKERKNRVTIGP